MRGEASSLGNQIVETLLGLKGATRWEVFTFSVSATSLFSRQTEKLFAEDEMRDLIGYRSEFPLPGDGIPATAGVRKLPYAVSGRGKRGARRLSIAIRVTDYGGMPCTPMRRMTRGTGRQMKGIRFPGRPQHSKRRRRTQSERLWH